MDCLVKQWRDDTPGCANQIHFNNAGAGLMPRAVLDAIIGHLNREASLGGYESADDAEAAVAEAYAHLAKVLGAQPRNIAVVENSTVAFFQALSAFDFKPGDVIVTTRNDYISNQLAYLSLAQRHGVEVWRSADLASGGADPQSVWELLRDSRVRLLGTYQFRVDAAGCGTGGSCGGGRRALSGRWLPGRWANFGGCCQAALRFFFGDSPKILARSAGDRIPVRVGPGAEARRFPAVHRYARGGLGVRG
jgi:hypothetical protein